MSCGMKTSATTPVFSLPLLEEQADLVEKHGVETLLYCPNPWAIRYVFINQNTGEVVCARCNRWDCLYCGPRKVDMWRQLGEQSYLPHPDRDHRANCVWHQSGPQVGSEHHTDPPPATLIGCYLV